MARHPFEIRYAPEVIDQILALGHRWRGLVRRTIEEQLSHSPLVETKQRKPLRRPDRWAESWEIRFGPGNRFRVFYRLDVPAHQVRVLAVGEKRGERLFVDGKEFEL